MRVVALKDCFVEGSRRKAGSTFEYDPGEKQLPAHLRAAEEVSEKEVKKLATAAKTKHFEGMVAAAGPKRAGTQAVKPTTVGYAVSEQFDADML